MTASRRLVDLVVTRLFGLMTEGTRVRSLVEIRGGFLPPHSNPGSAIIFTQPPEYWPRFRFRVELYLRLSFRLARVRINRSAPWGGGTSLDEKVNHSSFPGDFRDETRDPWGKRVGGGNFLLISPFSIAPPPMPWTR